MKPLKTKVFASFLMFSIWVGLCANLPLFAQNGVPEPAQVGFKAISGDELKPMLTFLASDVLEGRAMGERGLKIAAEYLASQYALAGLTPVPGQRSMLQTFPVWKTALNPATTLSVKFKNKSVETERIYSLFNDFLLMSFGTADYNVEAPVVFGGYGVEEEKFNDVKDLKAEGKILLLLGGRPEFLGQKGRFRGNRRFAAMRDMRRKESIARKTGALATLLVAEGDLSLMGQRFARFLKRPRFRLNSTAQDTPVVVISKNVADAILAPYGLSVDQLKAKIENKKKPVHIELEKSLVALHLNVDVSTVETQNVVAYLEGSDPELKQEVVGFSAHYDHIGVGDNGEIFNGADDDGSGTVAILELARAFARNPVRPKRSLIFISHTGEERGLLGSEYYTQHPLVPLEKTQAVLNIDMIGRNDPNSVYLIGSDFLSLELDQICKQANQAVGLNLDYKYNNTDDPERFYYRSDHYNYAKHNVPIIFFFTGTHEDYHQPTDTVEKINFAKMEKISRLIYLTGWKLANLDHRLKLDGKLVTEAATQ